MLFMFMTPSFCHQPEYQDPFPRLLLAYEQQGEQRAGILAFPARQHAPSWMALGPRSITEPLPIQSRLQERMEITLLQHTSPCCSPPTPPSCSASQHTELAAVGILDFPSALLFPSSLEDAQRRMPLET